MKTNKTDFWDDLSSEQKEEIEKVSLDIENGEVTDYHSFIKQYRTTSQNTDALNTRIEKSESDFENDNYKKSAYLLNKYK